VDCLNVFLHMVCSAKALTAMLTLECSNLLIDCHN
jgi:hypothetical protein